MLYLLRLAKRGVVENEEMDAYAKQVSFGRLILLVVVGVAAIIFGSHVAVEAASAIARIFGISERFIGLTIVAFGTSLPELVTLLSLLLFRLSCGIDMCWIFHIDLWQAKLLVLLDAQYDS